MSDIRVGDLVMVVSCHCDPKWIGQVFRVRDLEHANEASCNDCGEFLPPTAIARRGDKNWWYCASWLKRIPPLEEIERTEIVNKLTEAA